jgi:hypothetical protein
MNRAGLQVIAGCILGFDHELAGADERLIGFANRNNIPEMFITLLQAGPGTDLWVRLEKEGRLRHEGFDNRFGNQTGFPNFETSRPGKEIANEFINLYKVLYEPNAYLDRVFHYIAEMPPPPKRTSATAPYVSEIRASVIALFKQGVIYPSRMKFWKYLFEVMTKFPERSRTFFSAMILAEHYNDYRATIQEQIETRLLEMAAQIREADKSGRSADASV